MTKYYLAVLLTLSCNLSFAEDSTSTHQARICTQAISLNGNGWRIATDSGNVGRQRAWFKTPPLSDSKPTPVPWVIQDIFHDYHGLAWYWREFVAPPNLHHGGRYVLKFHAVDYLADVWVNGTHVGGHEGSETPFDMDLTDVLSAGGKNLLVVRVLNPTYQPIDGITLKDTPSGAKHYPVAGNAAYNTGGIIGSVELLLTPAVHIRDIVVVPDWKTGKLRIHTTILNTQPVEMPSSMSFTVADAPAGTTIAAETSTRSLKPGSNTAEAELRIPGHKLWCPEDPHLYRVTAALETFGRSSLDERSVRCGFRDFRFQDGYFRLNGKRLFLKGSNFCTHYPAGYTVPPCEDMLRRDVVNMKALGFNFVRIPFGCPNPRVLDVYDEMGILVQMEHYGCWQLGDHKGYAFPKPAHWQDALLKRYEDSIGEVILRDRNHASVVLWGLLNEMPDGIVFRKAVDLLPSLRALDPTRVFVLNSGRFDKVKDIGSMSNPASPRWDVGESELRDWHPYVWMPYSAKTLDELSGRSNTSQQKAYISETGLCFPIDLPSDLGDYQQWGKGQCDEARYFTRQYDKFLADWRRFDLGKCWVRPEEYIRDAYRTASSLRETAEAAIRSNPFVVSYTPTNSVADSYAGESVATNFRRLKPELIGSVLLANSSLRWCLSTEPQSIYKDHAIQLRVSFSSLDVLPPGNYPATVQVFGPDMKRVFEKKVAVKMPAAIDGREPPFAQTVLAEDIAITGEAGKYQLLATLDEGGTAVGGRTEFYVTDRAQLPKAPQEVVVCGTDGVVSNWLQEHNVQIRPFDGGNRSTRQLIVIVGRKPQDRATMVAIARQMACGSVAVFLSPSTFRSGSDTTRWLPLGKKGVMTRMDDVAGYYRADRWAKKHPVFDGMPSGGMMDYKYFRHVISVEALSQEHTVPAASGYAFGEGSSPLTYPAETICGATRIGHTYCSGVHVGVWEFGRGKVIVNTLHIAENLGKDPAADRLFCNVLNFASRDVNRPMERLPDAFDRQLVEIGYQK